jgi:hypothetical protein
MWPKSSKEKIVTFAGRTAIAAHNQEKPAGGFYILP